MADARSPRYPRLSVMSAFTMAMRFYDEAHRSEVDTATAYRILGFAGKSGSSASVLGAMRQYGLLEGQRGSVKISELGLSIIEPESISERQAGFKQAALNPSIFSEIMNHFNHMVPKSDEPIRAYLIRSKSFSSSGADECIKTFRLTLKEVADLKGEQNENIDVSSEPSFNSNGSDRHKESLEHNFGDNRAGTNAQSTRMQITLSRSCSVELKFVGDLNERALGRLAQQIEMMREWWGEAEE